MIPGNTRGIVDVLISGVMPDISKEGAAPIVPGNTRGIVDVRAGIGSKSVGNVYQRREQHQ